MRYRDNNGRSNHLFCMKRIDRNRVIKVLLVVAAVCTTAYLLMLGWFNTLSLDDYGFAVDLSHMTPWQWMERQYMTWQGRFSTFLVSGYIFEVWGRSTSLFSWTIIHLLLGYAVTYLYIRDVLKVKDVVNRCAIAILVSNITIMSVFDISTFYWLCCAGYFLVIYATLMLFYVLFVSKWEGWINTVVALLCALYICGSAENYTPLVLMILGIIWLVNIIKDTKRSSFKEAFSKQWLLFTVCAILGIGFIAMVAAPGNKVRMAQENGDMVGFMHQFNLVMFIKKTIIANVIFMLRVISRSFYWIGGGPLFMYVGKQCRDNEVKILQVKLWKGIGVATLVLLGFIFVAITACVYGLGYYPPLRSMSFISYAIMIYLAYVGCLIGHKMAYKKGQIVNGLVTVCAVCWIAFAGYETYREYPEAKRYYDYVMQRNEQIQQLAEAGSTETLYVDGFVWPEWQNTYSYLRTAINRCVGSKKVVNEPYFPYMVTGLDKNDPECFKNKDIRDYYQAQFDIFEK